MSVYREFSGKTVEEALRNARESFEVELNDLDIIASLEGDPRPRLGVIPFRTVVLEWDVAARAAPIDEVARRIAGELQNLIELVRGEHAE